MPQISTTELEVIQDTSFLKTKQSVTVKIRQLLGETRRQLLKSIRESAFDFPGGTDISMGKISRGENYRQLPYQVLDFPKLFKKENIFALRTMFWWGHFFSCTIHLQGKSLDLFRGRLAANFDQLLDREIYICIGETPWQYHYESDNYVLLKPDHLDYIKNCPFLKLSKKTSLQNWERIPDFSNDFFQLILGILY